MKKHYGFSLAELIVVILVAAIIVVFTLKLINNSAKNKTALSLYYLYTHVASKNCHITKKTEHWFNFQIKMKKIRHFPRIYNSARISA